MKSCSQANNSFDEGLFILPGGSACVCGGCDGSLNKKVVLFRSTDVAASGIVRPWPRCSPRCARIPIDCRSTITFRLARSRLLPGYDRVRIGSGIDTCGNARRDTIGYQLWPIGQCASDLPRASLLRKASAMTAVNGTGLDAISSDLDDRCGGVIRHRNSLGPSALPH